MEEVLGDSGGGVSTYDEILNDNELNSIIDDIASDLGYNRNDNELKSLIDDYLKLDNGEVEFKCYGKNGVLKYSTQVGRWLMDFNPGASGGNFEFVDNLVPRRCVKVSEWSVNESYKGLINILLEQAGDPVAGSGEEDSSTSDAGGNNDNSTTNGDDNNNTDNQNSNRTSSRCREELSDRFFCKRCEDGNSTLRCKQLWGNDLYEGQCFDFDKKKLQKNYQIKWRVDLGMILNFLYNHHNYKKKIIYYTS